MIAQLFLTLFRRYNKDISICSDKSELDFFFLIDLFFT